MISTSSWRQRKLFLATLEYTGADFTEHMVDAMRLYIRSSDLQLSREQSFLFLQLHWSFGVLIITFLLCGLIILDKIFSEKVTIFNSVPVKHLVEFV